MKLLLLVGAVLTVGWAADGAYSYDDQAAWGGVCTTGKHQSPIDINKVTDTVYYGSMISSFGEEVKIEKKTEGLMTVQWDLTDTPIFKNFPDDWPVGQTKGLQGLQMHVHWGKTRTYGSEHRLNGKQYDGEIHLVTRNLDQDDENASDYYAVLGVFIEAVDEGFDLDIDEDADQYISGMVSGRNDAVDLDVLFGQQGTNKHKNSVFTYEGSLTTPGCDEKVFWQVLEKPVLLSSSYFDGIREELETVEYNHRDIQELNGRHITHRLLNQLHTSEGGQSDSFCKVDCQAAQQTCMGAMSGTAATSLPSLALLFAALVYLM
ncbi:putative carbonic anhydrase 3 [Bolinopsis microptera]|uniref:putative carbonic anhydrase 3 n=1 Tax=Bolinopsis microptera TaxID=2820187 RepID=UPI00307910F3